MKQCLGKSKKKIQFMFTKNLQFRGKNDIYKDDTVTVTTEICTKHSRKHSDMRTEKI